MEWLAAKMVFGLLEWFSWTDYEIINIPSGRFASFVKTLDYNKGHAYQSSRGSGGGEDCPLNCDKSVTLNGVCVADNVPEDIAFGFIGASEFSLWYLKFGANVKKYASTVEITPTGDFGGDLPPVSISGSTESEAALASFEIGYEAYQSVGSEILDGLKDPGTRPRNRQEWEDFWERIIQLTETSLWIRLRRAGLDGDGGDGDIPAISCPPCGDKMK